MATERSVLTSSLRAKRLVSVGCDGVCGGELCSWYHVYKALDASVGEELPCKKDNGNKRTHTQ